MKPTFPPMMHDRELTNEINRVRRMIDKINSRNNLFAKDVVRRESLSIRLEALLQERDKRK